MTRISTVLPLVAILLASHTRLAAAEEARPVVLFDEGHGQPFKIDGIGPLHLSGIAAVMREQGLEVRSISTALTPASLEGVDALVVSGAFHPLAPEEIGAILGFLDNGGRLAVMLHIGPPVAALLHQLGVSISNGVIQEREGVIDESINFRVTRLEPDPLTAGLTGFSIYGGWALLPMVEPARSLAATSERAWVDLNRNRELDDPDAVQPFSVIVTGEHGRGRFVVFADDAMFQNRFLEGDNTPLAANLARWLVSR